MTSNRNSFQSPASSFTQFDRTEQRHVTIPQQHYQETSDLLPQSASLSFPPQGDVWSLNDPNSLMQHVGCSFQQTQAASDSSLDIGPFSVPQDAANNVDLQSLLKPATEIWRPLFVPGSDNVSYGYQTSVYAKGSGAMTEPAPNIETSSINGSDLTTPTYDSGFYSTYRCPEQSSYRQDVVQDDHSEVSAISGAGLGSSATRPRTGRLSSDSRLVVHNGKRRRSSQPLPLCNVCKNFTPKNRSDQIKHERKHTKPYKCRFEECIAKGVGFATENDLDRHYKSGKHGEAPTKGALKGFVCIACPQDGKPKWWPRQDNFKAHCNRRHATYNIEELMKASEHAIRPPNVYTDDNNTTFSDSTYQQRTFLQNEFVAAGAYDIAPLRQGEEILWSDYSAASSSVDNLAGVGFALHLADAHAGRTGSLDTDVVLRHTRTSRHPTMGFISTDVTQTSELTQPDLNAQSHDPENVHTMQVEADRLVSWPNAESNMLHNSTINASRHISPETHDAAGTFICTQCNKSTRRRCELKKHMKRHTRPYICTYPGCLSRHGSKSDWKRPEESQHVIQES